MPFAQFKKHEKHPERSEPATSSIAHPWCFSRFVNCANGTKSRKASHITISHDERCSDCIIPFQETY